MDTASGNNSPEIAALRRRVAECEAQIVAAQAQREVASHIVDNAPAFISRLTPEGEVVYVNRTCERILGYTADEVVGHKLLPLIYPGELMFPVEDYFRVAALGGNVQNHELVLRSRSGELRTLAWNSLHNFAPNGQLVELVSFGVDVTERKHAELEHRRLQDSIIALQNQTLAELSTPLMPISDRVVVMPLVGAIDAARAYRIMETLMTGVVERKARTAILDVTGVAVVDTQVAEALLRAASGVRLLGAEVILTGIRPEVAQTLTRLGTDMRGMLLCGSLQRGIALAMSRQR